MSSMLAVTAVFLGFGEGCTVADAGAIPAPAFEELVVPLLLALSFEAFLLPNSFSKNPITC